MVQINVSYNTNTCTVVCENLITPRNIGTIQWVADGTVTSINLSNFIPSSAFSTLPSAKNNWTGTLSLTSNATIVNYDISVIPASLGQCGPGTNQKAPHITITPADE